METEVNRNMLNETRKKRDLGEMITQWINRLLPKHQLPQCKYQFTLCAICLNRGLKFLNYSDRVLPIILKNTNIFCSLCVINNIGKAI